MKTKKLLLVSFLFLSCGLAGAQTNALAVKPAEQNLVISSDSCYFAGVTNQMVHLGHVFVTGNAKAKLNFPVRARPIIRRSDYKNELMP